jgi:hypothetical protein
LPIVAALTLGVALAGCGGSHAKAQVLSGEGYTFAAPAGWEVSRAKQSVQAGKGDSSVSVTVFRLTHPYRAALWPRVVPELDGIARDLADQLRGRSSPGTTVVVGGRRARRYDISFRRDGGDFVERITFVLDGRREYQLLCRYRAGADVRPCAALGSSFRLA